MNHPNIHQSNLSSNPSPIQILKHNLLIDTLNYNLLTASKQKKQKEQSIHQEKQSYQTYNHHLNQQIQLDRLQQLKKKYYIQNQLREEYNRQILRKKQQTNQIKQQEYSYLKAEKDYSNFAEERRMRQLAKMYKRTTYQAVLPNDHTQKIKTEPSIERIPMQFSKRHQTQQNHKQQSSQIKPKQQFSLKNQQNNPESKLSFNKNIDIQIKKQSNQQYSINKLSNYNNYNDSLDQLKKMEQKLKVQPKKQLDNQISYKNSNLKRFSPF